MFWFALLATALLGPSFSEACGQRPTFQSRVVNGEDALPHSWPWQISLRVKGQHICGGSLIRNDWVLTAAHCVARNLNPNGYTVVVGAHRRTGTTSVQQTFRLKRVIKHEQFSDRNLQNDVALLQLSGSIQASSQVNTVCLPTGPAATGAQCYITGWGRTVGGGNPADTLQQAMLPVASHSACNSVNGKLIPVDQASMICAGGQGKGGCQGDSGGPFVCNEGGKWILHGAVSWGHSQCQTDHYTVFARISNFVNWVNGKIGGGGGGGGGGPCTDSMPQSCPGWKAQCATHVNIRQACRKTCNECT